MIDKSKVLDYIQERLDFLEKNVVTDGVHSVPINSQVIALLVDIKDYIVCAIFSKRKSKAK